jgi:hypothetical protein
MTGSAQMNLRRLLAAFALMALLLGVASCGGGGSSAGGGGIGSSSGSTHRIDPEGLAARSSGFR